MLSFIKHLLCGNIGNNFAVEHSQQYTGLKDKNGKEIYGGDIVSVLGIDIKGNKIESRYTVCFGLYDNGEEYDDWVGGNGWYLGWEQFFRSNKRERGIWEHICERLMKTDNLEIIGNIYENPGLTPLH